MRVLICGGGVIGAAIAYFCSLKQADVVVIERTGVACAASGKSGGFLALDWCDASPLAPLARRSFELHAELASTFDGRWDYRRLESLGVVASAWRRPGAAASRLASPDWRLDVLEMKCHPGGAIGVSGRRWTRMPYRSFSSSSTAKSSTCRATASAAIP